VKRSSPLLVPFDIGAPVARCINERVFLWRNWEKRKKEIVGQAAKTTKAGIGARKIVTALNSVDQFLFIPGSGNRVWRTI
jgi:hypothetical protein